ncbi:MAG: gamma carbonic anhydrase family protein, partial [Candidatus Marinimicrobia bacterium]|nr:gamma carbonic anhydrase family protein [Candidatus Neomarinimicrobiota bacterium]
WFGSVVRGDMHYIRIGDRTNIQDNCTVHVTTDTAPTEMGTEVTVGHNAIVHGCTIEDRCLVGMGATIMDGAVIGGGSIIAAGTVITPGTAVPQRSLVAGVPGKLRRPVTDDEYAEIVERAAHYMEFAQIYRSQGAGLNP